MAWAMRRLVWGWMASSKSLWAMSRRMVKLSLMSRLTNFWLASRSGGNFLSSMANPISTSSVRPKDWLSSLGVTALSSVVVCSGSSASSSSFCPTNRSPSDRSIACTWLISWTTSSYPDISEEQEGSAAAPSEEEALLSTTSSASSLGVSSGWSLMMEAQMRMRCSSGSEPLSLAALRGTATRLMVVSIISRSSSEPLPPDTVGVWLSSQMASKVPDWPILIALSRSLDRNASDRATCRCTNSLVDWHAFTSRFGEYSLDNTLLCLCSSLLVSPLVGSSLFSPSLNEGEVGGVGEGGEGGGEDDDEEDEDDDGGDASLASTCFLLKKQISAPALTTPEAFG